MPPSAKPVPLNEAALRMTLESSPELLKVCFDVLKNVTDEQAKDLGGRAWDFKSVMAPCDAAMDDSTGNPVSKDVIDACKTHNIPVSEETRRAEFERLCVDQRRRYGHEGAWSSDTHVRVVEDLKRKRDETTNMVYRHYVASSKKACDHVKKICIDDLDLPESQVQVFGNSFLGVCFLDECQQPEPPKTAVVPLDEED